MIIRARWVLTMDGPPIENGAVAVARERIIDVGTWDEVRLRAGGEVLDLGDQILLPGLINAHCHLDYTSLRSAIPPSESFTGWIQAINAQKALLTAEDYLAAIAAGFSEAASFGTTTVANLEAFPQLLEQMPRPPLRTWWFAEMIDVRGTQSPAEVYRQMERTLVDECWLGGIGLAPHAPYTASTQLYTDAQIVAELHGLPLTTHLAESREETAMFRDARGKLFDFMGSLGRPMNDCGELTPVASLLQRARLNGRWLVAHLNEVTADDFELLRAAPRFHVVHCPRSHRYFGHAPFQYQRLRELGFNICLGTDSLASADDLNLFAEMQLLRQNEPTLSPAEILQTVTVNPAAALQQANHLGRIRRGSAADLIAIPCDSTRCDPLEQAVSHAGKVAWSMVDGERVITP